MLEEAEIDWEAADVAAITKKAATAKRPIRQISARPILKISTAPSVQFPCMTAIPRLHRVSGSSPLGCGGTTGDSRLAQAPVTCGSQRTL